MFYPIRKFKIRSDEYGLLFRDREFVRVLDPGRHYMFDPLLKVRVDIVSQREPWLQHEKLDIIAVPDFASGAMENAGAITFREPLLLLDGANAPEDQRRAFAGVMAHELAHQWFGNLVTMPWWDDIWLNEAFATWMGNKIVDRVHPEYETSVSMLASIHGAMSSRLPMASSISSTGSGAPPCSGPVSAQ